MICFRVEGGGPQEDLSSIDMNRLSARATQQASYLEAAQVEHGQSGSSREMAMNGYPIHPAGSKRISTSDIRGVLLDNMGVKRKAGGMFSFKVGDSLMQ